MNCRAGSASSRAIYCRMCRSSSSKGINVSVNAKGKLVIDFHVIVSYGVNIMAVTDNLISSVRYRVEDFTGLEVEKINVYVEGVRVID